jgi:hypothetical protein
MFKEATNDGLLFYLRLSNRIIQKVCNSGHHLLTKFLEGPSPPTVSLNGDLGP